MLPLHSRAQLIGRYISLILLLGVVLPQQALRDSFCPENVITNTSGLSSPTIGDFSSSEEEEEYSGRTYDLRCCVSGNPTPNIEWTKDGELVSQQFASQRFELKENNQVLDIRPVLPEDKGIYTCNATNQFGHATWAIDLYVIETEVDQKPSVHMPQTSWKVEEGSPVTLQCVVSGSFSRPVIAWIRLSQNKTRSRPRANGTKRTVTRQENQQNVWTSNLTIHHVKAEDQGVYICQARNGQGHGPPPEASGTLTVVENPILSPEAVKVQQPSSTALRWGLGTTGVVLVVVLLGRLICFLKKRQERRTVKYFTECPATHHGSGGDEECRCEVEFDVFISYNNNDKEWVNNVLRGGLSKSYKVCMDTVDFEPGKYIMDNIVHNIWVSRKILLVISRNFLKSEWCCFEKQIAQGKVILCKDTLIVIMLENLKAKELPKDLRHYKLEKTYLEWDNDEVKPHFWKRLNDAIGPSVFSAESGEETAMTSSVVDSLDKVP